MAHRATEIRTRLQEIAARQIFPYRSVESVGSRPIHRHVGIIARNP
jgi:hypothetical protein